MKSLSKILSQFNKPLNDLRSFVEQSNRGIAANLAHEIDLEKQLEANTKTREEIIKERDRAKTVIGNFENLLATNGPEDIGSGQYEDEEVPF